MGGVEPQADWRRAGRSMRNPISNPISAMATAAKPPSALEVRLATLAEAVTRLVAGVEQIVELLRSRPELAVRPDPAPLPQLETGFVCRDQVQLHGRELRVNGRTVGLSKLQAALLGILLRHALAGDPGYLTTARIIEEIDRDFAGIWTFPIPEDVHRVVCDLRRKLGMRRILLESSAAKGGGLRISTPKENIVPLPPGWEEEIKQSPKKRPKNAAHPALPHPDGDAPSS